MSITNIFTNGVLIDVNVRAWSAEKQLTPQDLGLPSDKLPKAFKLGKKTLIPPEKISKFKHLDYEVRKLLITRSFAFPFGGARFVPKKAIVEFDEDFKKISDSYNNEVNSLIYNYDKYRIEMRGQFLNAAKTAYARLSTIPNQMGIRKRNEKGKITQEVYSEDEFINMFLERIEQCYPDPQKLKDKYSMTYDVYQMSLPDLSQASIDDVSEENTKIQLLQKGYQSKMMREIQGYAEKIITENQQRAQTVIDDITTNIKEGKKFTEATLKKITNMIENYKRLNVTNDVTLENNLMKFKFKYLDPNSAKNIRDSEEIQRNMLSELTDLQKTLKDTERLSSLVQAYKEKIGI